MNRRDKEGRAFQTFHFLVKLNTTQPTKVLLFSTQIMQNPDLSRLQTHVYLSFIHISQVYLGQLRYQIRDTELSSLIQNKTQLEAQTQKYINNVSNIAHQDRSYRDQSYGSCKGHLQEKPFYKVLKR